MNYVVFDAFSRRPHQRYRTFKIKRRENYTTTKTDKLSQKNGFERAEFLLEKDTNSPSGNTNLDILSGEGHSPDNIVIWVSEGEICTAAVSSKRGRRSIGNLSDANLSEWANSSKKCRRIQKSEIHNSRTRRLAKPRRFRSHFKIDRRKQEKRRTNKMNL